MRSIFIAGIMVRDLLENVLSAASMDDIFRRHAIKQREGELLFSTIARLMTLVVCRVHRSVHAAYSAAGDVEVAIKSIYNKLNGVETQVSQALVRETAQRMNAMVEQMGVEFPAVISGLRTRIADRNFCTTVFLYRAATVAMAYRQRWRIERTSQSRGTFRDTTLVRGDNHGLAGRVSSSPASLIEAISLDANSTYTLVTSARATK